MRKRGCAYILADIEKGSIHIMEKFIRFCIIAFVFLCLQSCFLLHCFAKEANEQETDLNLYAQAAVLMDAESGRVLYGKNEKQVMPMASTTKIMTCIVALENGNPDDYVEVSSYAAGMPKVHLSMRTGEYYKLEDLLYSLMLESHNDSAVAIAEHVGGSVEGFAEMMNQKARDIGCFDTYFITPNGLDATVKETGKCHSTTAEDLARIMSYCIGVSEKKEEFLKITRTTSHGFSNYVKNKDNGEMSTGSRYFSCNNHNAFLTMMDGALSGKTGFTSKAGYCYVGALKKDNRTFVVALLACGWPNNRTYKWSDTKQLMSYGLDNYEYHSFSEKPIDKEALSPIFVENGQTDEIGRKAYINIEVAEKKEAEHDSVDFVGDSDSEGGTKGLLLRKDEEIEVNYQIPKKLTAPVEKGRVVGKIQYCVEGKVYQTKLVVTSTEAEAIDFVWCLEKVLWNFGL